MNTITEIRWNDARKDRPKHLQRCLCFDSYMGGMYCYVYDDISKYWCTQTTEEHDANGGNHICDYADSRVVAWAELPKVAGGINAFNSFEAFMSVTNKKTASNNKFYYIENTVDESDSEITAYCKTLKEAKEKLKTCCDWYGEMGTGRIYEVEFGKGTIGKLVYEKE